MINSYSDETFLIEHYSEATPTAETLVKPIQRDMNFIVVDLPRFNRESKKVEYKRAVFWKGRFNCFLREGQSAFSCESTLRMVCGMAREW